MKVANAPCSWGVLEFELEGETTGYAQVLDEMQQTGYVGTELGDWDFMPGEPAKLKKELQSRELVLIAAFVPVAFAQPERHEEGEAIALRTARLLADVAGNEPFIVLADDNGKVNLRTKYAGRIKPQHGLNPEQWQVFEGVFCELGKGDVDFPAIICELNKLDYDGWIVVEQDVLPGMGAPKESAQRNRDYLKSIGL